MGKNVVSNIVSEISQFCFKPKKVSVKNKTYIFRYICVSKKDLKKTW